MTFALVVGGSILSEAATLPTAGRDLTSGLWVLDLAAAPPAAQEACGWFAVAVTERPAETETTTSDRSLLLVDAVPTEAWTVRDKTAGELDADVREANTAVLLADATTNIATLLAAVDALNALTALTNAEINQNPASHIKALARECKTVARQTVRIARLLTGSTLAADSGS